MTARPPSGDRHRVLANHRRAELRRGALVKLITRALPRGPVIAEPAEYVFGALGPAISALPAREREALFPALHLDHVIDVNFAGLSDLVDAIGCVYTDVDHRYDNDTALTDYSSINIQPGYQKLCGDNQADTGALAFLRFRHTDSDIVRNARQLDFLRSAAEQISATHVSVERLARILGTHVTTDASLHAVGALVSLLRLLLRAASGHLAAIPFRAQFGPCGGARTPCYVTATRRSEAAAYRRFLRLESVPSAASVATPTTRGLIAANAVGREQAAALGNPGLPVYYPEMIEGGSAYCSSILRNCNVSPNPTRVYAGAYPRAYRIPAPAARPYAAYRMTLVMNSALGEYYGVQGTTWSDPPILAHPTRAQVVDGKTLLEYFAGSRLSLVAWRSPHAVYWVSNTLTDTIPNGQLLAIAASLRPAG